MRDYFLKAEYHTNTNVISSFHTRLIELRTKSNESPGSNHLLQYQKLS